MKQRVSTFHLSAPVTSLLNTQHKDPTQGGKKGRACEGREARGRHDSRDAFRALQVNLLGS